MCDPKALHARTPSESSTFPEVSRIVRGVWVSGGSQLPKAAPRCGRHSGRNPTGTVPQGGEACEVSDAMFANLLPLRGCEALRGAAKRSALAPPKRAQSCSVALDLTDVGEREAKELPHCQVVRQRRQICRADRIGIGSTRAVKQTAISLGIEARIDTKRVL